MRIFLHDKNRINQLSIRIKNFYAQMTNIQRKWRSVYETQEARKSAVMHHLIKYKNQLRDTICLNQNLYKKYDWLIEELTQGDYDPEHKKGHLYKVATDWNDFENLNFQLNYFRWINLYSEIGELDEELDLMSGAVTKMENLKKQLNENYDAKMIKRYPNLEKYFPKEK